VIQQIGIYGGGQLGAYLCMAARQLGLRTSVMAFSEDSMAREFADRCIVAEPADVDAVRGLLSSSDVLTFELEDVPAAALDEIALEESAGHIKVAPSVDVLRRLQSKYTQKMWLREQGFPTADFIHCPDDTSLETLSQRLGLPFVQKASRGGYDGKGVQLIRDPADVDRLWRGNAFAERFVPDKRELAVLVARGRSGDARCYPVIEMIFDNEGHVLEQAHAPACLAAPMARQAQDLATTVVDRLGAVGVFAVELFLTAHGELLINEISPRVHNSGHLTIEGHTTSQYEQHLRAITGRPLGDVSQRAPAVMRNLLHSGGLVSAPKLDIGATPRGTSTHLHWYGKKEGKPLRKMGHITATAPTLTLAERHVAAAYRAISTSQLP
jgi:5-(carboxyamino)imidazole ribonucleotide synthase